MRLLLVEDEPRLAETVRRGLAAEGFVVDVEHDDAGEGCPPWALGRLAIRLVRRHAGDANA